MKKRISTIVSSLCLLAASASGQPTRIEPVGSAVCECVPEDAPNTPLGVYVRMYRLLAAGKQGSLRTVCSLRNHGRLPDAQAPDKAPDERLRESFEARRIEEVRYYGDSAAAVLVRYEDLLRIIGWTTFEQGRWVNAGEEMGHDLIAARRLADTNAPSMQGLARRVAQLSETHPDTAALVRYLGTSAQTPKAYFLDKLSAHRLVICGELHRRSLSWAFMKELANDPRFPEVAGTVFVELPSWKQDRLDRFYAEDTMQPELLLDLLRDEQIYGWWDGGIYKFLQQLWQVNRTLPAERRIRVAAVDRQVPWERIRDRAELLSWEREGPDRDSHMAATVTTYIEQSNDPRGALFIVGFAHAARSQAPAIASGASGNESGATAGAQLAARLPQGSLCILFPHTRITHNRTGPSAPLREGAFDAAFARNGNIPVAFDLRNSPFGCEPFDAIDERRFDLRAGTYADNFDGYLFFGPSDSETGECRVYELFTDTFVAEIKRRASLAGFTELFALPLDELTPERIVRQLER